MFRVFSFLTAAPWPNFRLHHWAAVPFTISINHTALTYCKSPLSDRTGKTVSPWNFNTETIFFLQEGINFKSEKTDAESVPYIHTSGPDVCMNKLLQSKQNLSVMQQQHCLFRVNVTFGSHDDGNMVRLNFTCQKATLIEFKYVLGIILSLKSDFNNSSTPFHICSPGFCQLTLSRFSRRVSCEFTLKLPSYTSCSHFVFTPQISLREHLLGLFLSPRSGCSSLHWSLTDSFHTSREPENRLGVKAPWELRA